jgi:glutamine cyclotransferase
MDQAKSETLSKRINNNIKHDSCGRTQGLEFKSQYYQKEKKKGNSKMVVRGRKQKACLLE